MLMMTPRQNADLALAQKVVESDADSLHRLATNGQRPLLGLVPGASQARPANPRSALQEACVCSYLLYPLATGGPCHLLSLCLVQPLSLPFAGSRQCVSVVRLVTRRAAGRRQLRCHTAVKIVS